MNKSREPYVKPAVLQLDFSVDVPVTLSASCKTSQTTGSGSSPCDGGANPCTSAGS